MNYRTRACLLVLLTSFAWPSHAKPNTTPEKLLKTYEAEAKKNDASFKAFSADKGKKFYNTENKNKKGEVVSCASCHTADPTKAGKTRVGKKIEPLAPSINKGRFTDTAHVEKWFKRNCKDVYDRECTVQEKGDFIAYLLSL